MSAVLTVITGPMFSGKTERLIGKLKIHQIAKLRSLVLSPVFDNRKIRTIQTHAEVSSGIVAFSVQDEKEARAHISENEHRVLLIDEAQFFGNWIIDIVRDVLRERANDNYEVIIGGLDMDYMQQPFGPMPLFMSMADEVVKLRAVCDVCHMLPESAIFTQKIAGNLAVQNEVGDKETYRAVCRSCY